MSDAPDKTRLWISIGILVAGIYWFGIRPFERRWLVRRQFIHRPDRDIAVELRVFADTINQKSVLAQTEVNWQAFTKIVNTPAGVLLYFNDQIYWWLPRHSFINDIEFDRFIKLSKSKIPKYYDVA